MIQAYNPRTGEPAGNPVPETTEAEVDTLVRRAAEAAGEWVASERRAEALEAIADALDDHAEDLVAIADTETALGTERLTGEVARASGQFRLFAGVVRNGEYRKVVHTEAVGPAPDLRRALRPLGPVAVFAASNFPFAFSVAGGDTASALAAGCPVIVKAHEGHPGTSELSAAIIAGALEAAGVAGNPFGLIHGVDAGLALLRHPLITAAGFTGSIPGGLALQRVCAERPVPIPFFGEMGAVNPVVVLPGAASGRPREIADGYAGSLTLGAGQFCTNPGLLFVPDEAEILSAVSAAAGNASGGPMLTERIFRGYESAVAEAAAHPGLSELASGQPGEGPWGATPRVYTTSLKEFAADVPVLARERFGPAGIVVTYPSVDELLPVLAGLPGNLVGTLHAAESDLGDARRLVPVLEWIAGRVVYNGWPTGVAVVPAQQHGGPYPATTSAEHTSVGSAAINRWLVPVAYQNFPAGLL
ncbi:MAG: aldehyde dehydrogenase (NADP(+)) [Streptosporangiales bacterium]|nr:aldehyde dehydrogenase (NADP(+)) [Streptosporangiales bacterium]